MQLDLNGLNASDSLVTRPVTLHFAAAPNSFFPFLSLTTCYADYSPARLHWLCKTLFGRG
jgi:hypothetical protein